MLVIYYNLDAYILFANTNTVQVFDTLSLVLFVTFHLYEMRIIPFLTEFEVSGSVSKEEHETRLEQNKILKLRFNS